MIDLRKIPFKKVYVNEACECGETSVRYNQSDPRALGQSTSYCIKCNNQRSIGGRRIRYPLKLVKENFMYEVVIKCSNETAATKIAQTLQNMYYECEVRNIITPSIDPKWQALKELAEVLMENSELSDEKRRQAAAKVVNVLSF